MRWIPILLVIALTACETPKPPVAAGDSFTGSLPLYGKRIFLPKGRWTVAGAEYRQGSTTLGYQGPGYSHLYLFSQDSEAFLIRVMTNANTGSRGWTTSSSNCATKGNILFQKVNQNVYAGDQDCWWIWGRGIGAAKSDLAKKSVSFMAHKGSYLPSAAVVLNFRMATTSDYMVVQYYFDPSLKGVYGNWRNKQVLGDKDMSAYLKRIKNFGQAWHPQVKNGFEGEIARAKTAAKQAP